MNKFHIISKNILVLNKSMYISYCGIVSEYNEVLHSFNFKKDSCKKLCPNCIEFYLCANKRIFSLKEPKVNCFVIKEI